MELKKHLNDLQNIKTVDTQFQKKLGEITIWLNDIQSFDHITHEAIINLIGMTQGFLCHNYYNEYQKVKINENTAEKQNCSTYDNCMNLILIIAAKIAKISAKFGVAMLDAFIDHVNSHLECFNYIISFYRLYITCPQIKQCGKTYGLYNNLFPIYRQIHQVTEQYEPQYKMKNLRSLITFRPNGDNNFKWINSGIDKKYLFENYLQLTDRPNNNSNPNGMVLLPYITYHYIDYFPMANQFQNEFAIHTKSSNSGINIQASNLNSQSQSNSNIVSNLSHKGNSNNLSGNHPNQNSNSNNLSNTGLSRTERKNINIRLSSDMQQNTAEISLNLKDVPKGLKAKIPMLKFPIDKSQPQHRYSIIRSSHRAEFSKSGDGSSTSTTKNINNIKFGGKKETVVVENSVNRNYTKEMVIMEPKEKLKLLAIQLGESCLAAGLAALINQKREMELGKIKQSVNSSSHNIQYNSNNQSCSSSQKSPKVSKYIEKLKSNNDIEIDTNDDAYYDTPNNKWNSKRSSKNYCNKSDNCIEKEKSSYSIQPQNQTFKNFQKIREILANFLLTCLREYSIEDINYLKLNVNVIYSYLTFPTLESHKMKLERKGVEMMEHMKDYSQIEAYVGNGNMIYQSENIITVIQKVENQYLAAQAGNNITHSNNNEDYAKVAKPKKDKTMFESFLSITFEEDNNCSLALKTESDALYELLQLYATNIEIKVKAQQFCSNLYVPPQNSIREFITNGINFSSMNILNVEILRKHIDPFVDLIRNKICFLLKSYDLSAFYSNISDANAVSNEDDDYIMKMIKQQLDILIEYINTSKSRIITSHLLIHLSDMLIILKKSFIQLLFKFNVVDNGTIQNNHNNNNGYSSNVESKSGPHCSPHPCTGNAGINMNNQTNTTFNNNNINNNTTINLNNNNMTQEITERYEIKIPDKLIEVFASFISLLATLISHSNLPFEHKFLNETFITCPFLSEASSFLFDYFLTNNLNKDAKRDNSKCNTNTNRTNSNKNNLVQILKDGISKFNETFLESFRLNVKYSLIWINFYHNCNLFFHKIIKEDNANGDKSSNEDDSEKDSKKYWTNAIRDHMQSLQKFLNSKTGSVFDLFTNTTGAGFLFSKIKISVIFTHFNLIRGLLTLQESTLEFPSKYSTIVNEETSLDYIRLHYISFIKLYNKNMIFNPNLGEVSTIIANCEKTEKRKTIRAFVKDVTNDQNLLRIIIILCKMHLKCLFALAKNRNADVTNKFFQLRIVDYMTKELDLEHEAAEKVYKFNRLNNNNCNMMISNDKEKTIDIPSVSLSNPIIKPTLFNTKKSNEINIQLDLEALGGGHEEKKEKKVIIEKLELGIGQEKDVIIESKNEDKDMDYSDEDLDDDVNLDMNIDLIKEDNEEDNEDEDDDDFDDIPLVEPSLSKYNYEDKIPKLSLLPNAMGSGSYSEVNDMSMGHVQVKKANTINLSHQHQLQIQNDQPQVQTAHLHNEDSSKAKTKQAPITEDDTSSNKPKIQLKLNLNLCKSSKNEQLKQELSMKVEDEPSTNKAVSSFNVTISKHNDQDNQTPKTVIQLPTLQIGINQQKSPIKTENISIDISKENNQTPDKNQTLANSKLFANKIQVEIEKHLKQKYNLFYQKALTEGLNEQDFSNVSQFYLKERNTRLLYQDPELQVLIISIIICLIITPSRGTFEELYCSVFPYENNKMNLLYILHHHLNRQENEIILPVLMKYSSEIFPFGAGQRLLKLLCTKFFNASIYTNWDKIASGQFGVVYQCNTHLSEPGIVAIKKIELEHNIFDACHLFDIFTEITALETFRLENCVTQLYDYGCDKENYYIVMKRYPQSLKDWRIKQTGPLREMLPTYLGIFKDILEAIRIIHTKNTTHYDIKCDNIVLDFLLDNTSDQEREKYSYDNTSSENSICIRVADFGECRIFLNDQDEYCTRARGTDVIKSPEMLNTGYPVSPDDDNFDRRRKRGTTRSSDIWSLGCLFYELLTGNFLFNEIQDDYIAFTCKINKKEISVNDLLTEEKMAPLENNPYIIDFLKSMLVKKQECRPDIKAIIMRFQHVNALVVGSTGFIPSHILNNNEYYSKRLTSNYFDLYLEQCESMMNKKNKSVPYDFHVKSIPQIVMLTSDMYSCDYSYVESNCEQLIQLGITHIVSWTNPRTRDINEKFQCLNIIDLGDHENDPIEHLSLFNYIYKTIDFLRYCMVYQGKVLFIDDYLYTNVHFKDNFLIRSIIILIFSFLFNQNAYDTWTYLNSKLLFFNIPKENLMTISQWIFNQNLIFNYLSPFPILRCLCGGCQIVLKRSSSNSTPKKCTCQYGQCNQQYSECPSNGCFDYISSMKTCYDITYDSLQWLTVSMKDFFIGPGEWSTITNPNHKKIALFSRGLEENLTKHSINDKYSIKVSGRKNTWIVNKCRICQSWIYGESNDKIQLLMNNVYNYNKKLEQRKTLMKSNHLKQLNLRKLL